MMALLEIHDFLLVFTASSSSHQHNLIYISQWINLKLYITLLFIYQETICIFVM